MDIFNILTEIVLFDVQLSKRQPIVLQLLIEVDTGTPEKERLHFRIR